MQSHLSPAGGRLEDCNLHLKGVPGEERVLTLGELARALAPRRCFWCCLLVLGLAESKERTRWLYSLIFILFFLISWFM